MNLFKPHDYMSNIFPELSLHADSTRMLFYAQAHDGRVVVSTSPCHFDEYYRLQARGDSDFDIIKYKITERIR